MFEGEEPNIYIYILQINNLRLKIIVFCDRTIVITSDEFHEIPLTCGRPTY